MKTPRVLPFLVVAAAAACSSWRWSGGGPREAPTPLPEPIALSTGAPQARVEPVVAPTPEERARSAEFYSDFGAPALDVSAYPAQQRYNYSIYARVCSRCHTLARANFAPIVGRGWWEFYVAGMRARSRWRGRPLAPDEVKAVLDFLDYDGRVRKVDAARDFERITDELKRRFDAEMDRRIGAMREASPRETVPPSPER